MSEQKQTQGALRYAGLATQWMVMLLIAVYAGIKADGWLKWRVPVFTVVLPLGILILSLWKLIKEFSKPGK